MAATRSTESGANTPPPQLRADEMTLIQSVSGHGLIANGIAAAVTAMTVLRVGDTVPVMVWLACIFVALGLRYLLYIAYKRAEASLRADKNWGVIVAGSNFLIGACWGWAAFAFFGKGVDSAEGVGLLISIAVAAASAQTISPTRSSLAALLAPMLLPLMVKLLLMDVESFSGPAVLILVLLLTLWFSVSRYRALLANAIESYEKRSTSDAAMILGAETANRLFAQVVIERERAEAELQVAKQAADDANQAKGDFLAYTSHEIRTPLTAVIGFSDALLLSEQSLTQQDYSRRIKGASLRLLTLINDLLDLSKIEAGKLNIEFADFELRQTLDEVVQEQGVKAREKHVTLALEIDEPVPDGLLGDSLRLRQILLNLIGNAIKFTPENGRVTTHARLISNTGGMARVAFRVTDTGIGIPADKLASMFQRYTQADASTARKYGGTGLGLSICKSLVELMDGKIGVASEAGKGSEFWFELPFKVTEKTMVQEAQPPATVEKPASERANFTGMRVLVTEDNENIQLLIELLLKRRGVEVTLADNGAIAAEHLRSQEYDLVFMDLEMPVMGGFDAVACIRGEEKTSAGARPRALIVALSAHAPEEERDHCLAVGMDDYLMKPFDPAKLYRMLHQYLPPRLANREDAKVA